jgi:hypothetical protein
VRKYGGIPPYEETMTYVKRALTVYYGAPYGQADVVSRAAAARASSAADSRRGASRWRWR